MGAIRRTINLIIALVLVALGCGGLAYFYFIAATRNGWLALASGIVGSAGLYWLWDEHTSTRAPDRRIETMPRDGSMPKMCNPKKAQSNGNQNQDNWLRFLILRSASCTAPAFLAF